MKTLTLDYSLNKREESLFTPEIVSSDIEKLSFLEGASSVLLNETPMSSVFVAKTGLSSQDHCTINYDDDYDDDDDDYDDDYDDDDDDDDYDDDYDDDDDDYDDDYDDDEDDYDEEDDDDDDDDDDDYDDDDDFYD